MKARGHEPGIWSTHVGHHGEVETHQDKLTAAKCGEYTCDPASFWGEYIPPRACIRVGQPHVLARMRSKWYANIQTT
jgi:hypothetical protein